MPDSSIVVGWLTMECDSRGRKRWAVVDDWGYCGDAVAKVNRVSLAVPNHRENQPFM